MDSLRAPACAPLTPRQYGILGAALARVGRVGRSRVATFDGDTLRIDLRALLLEMRLDDAAALLAEG